jgi:hypothetical protein
MRLHLQEYLSLSLYPKNAFSTIASGATTIGSVRHAPNEIIMRKEQITQRTRENSILEFIPNFFSTIASGATTIGSAGRALNEISVSKITRKTNLQRVLLTKVTTIRREFVLIEEYMTQRFSVFKQSNKAENDYRIMILELRHRDKTRMPRLK